MSKLRANKASSCNCPNREVLQTTAQKMSLFLKSQSERCFSPQKTKYSQNYKLLLFNCQMVCLINRLTIFISFHYYY